jgi:hypothetical protein
LLAAIEGTPGVSSTFTVSAARYGAVNASGTSVSWVSGTQFAGIAAGSSCSRSPRRRLPAGHISRLAAAATAT